MLVADLMTTDLIMLNEADNLDLARMEMDLARIRHLPVVRAGRLVGLVTHRDILKAMCSVFAGIDGMEQSDILQEVPVKQIMSREVRTIEPDLDAAEAGRLLLDNKFGCLPVVSEGNLLVGIVTEADFVELAIHYLRQHDGEDEEDEGSGEIIPGHDHGRFVKGDEEEEDW